MGGERVPTKSNNIGGRGGARPGAGRKKTAVKEKAANGNPGGRKLEVLDIPEVEGVDMPKPHDFLSAEQRDGSTLQAEEIYRETWEWLKKIGCSAKVSPQLLERYAMCSARWIQCEEMTNRMGFLSKHPTTQKPIPSPFSGLPAFLAVLHPKEFECYAVTAEFLCYALKIWHPASRYRCLLFWKKQSL